VGSEWGCGGLAFHVCGIGSGGSYGVPFLGGCCLTFEPGGGGEILGGVRGGGEWRGGASNSQKKGGGGYIGGGGVFPEDRGWGVGGGGRGGGCGRGVLRGWLGQSTLGRVGGQAGRLVVPLGYVPMNLMLMEKKESEVHSVENVPSQTRFLSKRVHKSPEKSQGVRGDRMGMCSVLLA